jgi:signal transduction histidine kinase
VLCTLYCASSSPPTFSFLSLTQLAGFISSKLIWEEVLAHGFASDITGLTIVLTTGNHVHTFGVKNGVVKHQGDGDRHDPNALFHMDLVINNPNHFNEYTVEYAMEVYSTDEFIESYRVRSPWMSMIGAAAIIIIPSLFFFLYDFYVRKEFNSKRNLFEAKRQFVRFISHEVRTPLNTVCMGLTLLRHDFASSLGVRKKTASDVESDSSTYAANNDEQLEDWMLLSIQISENAEAAVGILTDLLNYDKIQTGSLTLELAAVPIWSVIEKTFSEFKIAAIEKKVNFELDFSPLVKDLLVDIESGRQIEASTSRLPSDIRGCKVVGDIIRLSQVLRNLISNGLKFSKEQGKFAIVLREQSACI